MVNMFEIEDSTKTFKKKFNNELTCIKTRHFPVITALLSCNHLHI